jgi:hypothetical protein
MRTLTAARVEGLRLPPVRSWLSIGADGAILFATPAARGQDQTTLHCWRPTSEVSVRVAERVSPDVRPEVQLLPNQEWLYVRPVTGENNIRIYAFDGTPVGRFVAGFSVRHCQSSTRGDVWVGYGDEGIFGPEQPGNAGLNCFDTHGNRLFRYDEFAERHKLPPVFGCYALNVASETDVWMYYYQSFSLVHLVDKELAEFWPRIPIYGARAMAIGGGNVLLQGTYEDYRHLQLVRLDSLSVEGVMALDPNGRPVDLRRGYGRGSSLYLEGEDSLFLLDVLTM